MENEENAVHIKDGEVTGDEGNDDMVGGEDVAGEDEK